MTASPPSDCETEVVTHLTSLDLILCRRGGGESWCAERSHDRWGGKEVEVVFIFVGKEFDDFLGEKRLNRQ